MYLYIEFEAYISLQSLSSQVENPSVAVGTNHYFNSHIVALPNIYTGENLVTIYYINIIIIIAELIFVNTVKIAISSMQIINYILHKNTYVCDIACKVQDCWSNILYSWKYWQKLNLAVGPQIAIAKILADLNLAVW